MSPSVYAAPPVRVRIQTRSAVVSRASACGTVTPARKRPIGYNQCVLGSSITVRDGSRRRSADRGIQMAGGSGSRLSP